MRVVIQRVQKASVSIDGNVVGKCGYGYLLFVGFTHDDNEKILDVGVGHYSGSHFPGQGKGILYTTHNTSDKLYNLKDINYYRTNYSTKRAISYDR